MYLIVGAWVMGVLNGVTNLGDAAVLLPLAGLMLFFLLSVRRRREALRWLAAVALCVGSTAMLKIYFFDCPVGVDLSSPSGHASLSTLVYGAAIVVVAAECGGPPRLLVICIGVALIFAIALSRVLLGAHSPDEVVLGVLIGAASLALFAQAYLAALGKNLAAVPLRRFVVAAIVLIVALHGHQLHAEELLYTIGLYLRATGAGGCG